MREPPAIELETLRAAVGSTSVLNPAPTVVADLAYDARAVTPGALFVCVPGQRADGHDFAADAVRRGWITPAAVGPGMPPPRAPLTKLADLLAELEKDRSDR